MLSPISFRALPWAALLVSCLAGCTKDAPTVAPPPTPAAPAAPTPAFRGAYGVLVAQKVNFIFTQAPLPVPVTLESEIGFAAFNNPGTTAYLDAGAVAVNTIALEKQPNNTYSKVATVALTPATLNFSSSVNWSVVGGNGVNALTYSHASPFPTYSGTLPTTVTRSAGLTVPLGSSNLSGADSVYVQVSVGNASVLRRAGGSAASVTFTAAQLAALPAAANNAGFIQVVPFRYVLATLNGRAYAFVKLAANSSTVTVQ